MWKVYANAIFFALFLISVYVSLSFLMRYKSYSFCSFNRISADVQNAAQMRAAICGVIDLRHFITLFISVLLIDKMLPKTTCDRHLAVSSSVIYSPGYTANAGKSISFIVESLKYKGSRLRRL